MVYDCETIVKPACTLEGECISPLTVAHGEAFKERRGSGGRASGCTSGSAGRKRKWGKTQQEQTSAAAVGAR